MNLKPSFSTESRICGDGVVEIAVDEDVALGRGDQEGAEIVGADVIDVAHDLESGPRFVEGGVVLGEYRKRQQKAG